MLPFLYPLVALPAAFVTVGLTIHTLSGRSRRNAILTLPGAYIVVSIGAGVMRWLYVASEMQEALVPGHAPVASLTSAIALLGWLALRRRPDERFERYLAVRRAIVDDPRGPAFRAVLAALDAGYAHANDEGLFLISGRNKQAYTVNRNVPLEAARHTARAGDLVYLVERPPGRLEIDR